MPSEKKRIETIGVYCDTNFFMSGIVWTWARMDGEGEERLGGGGGTCAAHWPAGLLFLRSQHTRGQHTHRIRQPLKARLPVFVFDVGVAP